jgi:TP901 family phage tail tape measure protein
MAGKNDGIITRKEIITDEGLKWGDPYGQTVDLAIAKNKEFKTSILDMASVLKTIKGAYDNSSYLAARDQENLSNLNAINLIKQMTELEKGLEKIKQEKINTTKKQEDANTKLATTQKSSIKLTIEEKIENEILNRDKRQAAILNSDLVGSYQKLNLQRTLSKRALMDLIAAENQNTAAIVKAQMEFDRLDAKVKKADDAVRDFTKNVGNYPEIGKLRQQLTDLVGAFGLVVGIQAFASILKSTWTVIKEFDQAIADLQAITGASGEDLDFLREKAIELGKGTKDGAKGVVEAYKLIAGAKPELLSNVDALNQVTEAVITLSKASGLELPAAATALTDAMNQFGADADQATKFIDTLAAGAKFGAAEIPQITDALLKFGAVARTSNVSIQESTALIELLAENGLKGAEAGTQLRNILLKLSAPDALPKKAQEAIKKLGISFADLSDESKPIQERLEKLKPLLKDNAGLVQVFGVENVVAATNVLEHTERLEQLTEQVDENGVAQEQATIRSNTLMAATDRLSSAYDSYVLSQTEATGGTKFFTQILSYLGDNFEKVANLVIKLVSIYAAYLITTKAVLLVTETYAAVKAGLAAAEVSFVTATGLGTTAMKARTAATIEATAATKALDVATKSTPWGAILGIIVALGVAFYAFSDAMSEAEMQTLRLKNESKKLNDQAKINAANANTFRDKSIKGIEAEISIRRKAGEDGKKLDAEEISRKREVLFAELNFLSQMQESEQGRTKTLIRESALRIKAFQKEQQERGITQQKIDQLGDAIGSEKNEFGSLQNQLKTQEKITIAAKEKVNRMLAELNQKALEDAAEKGNEESKEEKSRREKARQEYLKNLKKRDQDENNLLQFRLQRAKDLNLEIVEDDKTSLDDRLESFNEAMALELSILENTTEQKLKDLSRYDDSVRDLSDAEIERLIAGGEIKKKLTKDEILLLEELTADKEELLKKQAKAQQDLIDKEVALSKKKVDAALLDQDTELKKTLEAENIQFNSLIDGQKKQKEAIEEHERQVAEIKEYYAKQALNKQVEALEALLLNSQISAEKRKEIENQLANAKFQISEIGANKENEEAEKKIEREKEQAEKIKEVSIALHDELVNLANSIFEQKIANIDAELQHNDEFYAKQIELAGNDQKLKDRLQIQQEKKREELENKKRKEQIKQAIFNKSLAIVEAGINTAKAITAALATTPPASFALAALTAGLAAVQLVAIAATPIPKFKHGRQDGPKTLGIVGDGGKHEVIERAKGGLELTPKFDTLVQLEKGDKVHASVEDYEKQQRKNFLNSINSEGKMLTNFQMLQYIPENRDGELLEEMRLTRKAIEKSKKMIKIENKIDYGHHVWANNQRNW